MSAATLFLARHGNTFEAGQKPVWVGARTDMPLTASGEAQARALGRDLARRGLVWDAPVAGPLLRTTRTAELVAAALGLGAVRIEERLREIDYGLWEGRDSVELAVEHHAALEAWERCGVWPEGMGWQPELATLQARLRSFLDEEWTRCTAGEATRLAVTSNGILRILYTLVTGQEAGECAKVKTGHLCALTPQREGWQVQAWNLPPSP